MSRYCKNCYSSNIDTFLKNMQWVVYIYLWPFIYIMIHISDPRHTTHGVLKSHRSKMSIIYMLS